MTENLEQFNYEAAMDKLKSMFEEAADIFEREGYELQRIVESSNGPIIYKVFAEEETEPAIEARIRAPFAGGAEVSRVENNSAPQNEGFVRDVYEQIRVDMRKVGATLNPSTTLLSPKMRKHWKRVDPDALEKRDSQVLALQVEQEEKDLEEFLNNPED